MVKALTTIALALAVAAPAAAAPKAGKKKQILFFTKSSGFEHPVIKESDGKPSLAAATLQELAAGNGFELTHSKDGGLFTPEGIGKFDAFVFYTSGDLTTEGKDKNPPMSAEGKQAFLRAVAGGKGFVGIHGPADTFHNPGDRFKDDGDSADPFTRMVGGELIRHGAQQTARVVCVDARFPGLAACKQPFDQIEEWYSLKNLAKDMHVLMYLQTWTMKNTGEDSVYRRPPFPVTWTRMEGKGRVFFTALGHREDVWASPLFQQMVVGALKWATGETSADVKANAATVTPGFTELPPDDKAPAR